jgi:hypothetical protein
MKKLYDRVVKNVFHVELKYMFEAIEKTYDETSEKILGMSLRNVK